MTGERVAAAFGGEPVAPPLLDGPPADGEGAGASVGAPPGITWHLLKTALDPPQAAGRASTRVMLTGSCTCLEAMAAQRQSTMPGLLTAVFTSPQQVLPGRAVLLPGCT